MIIINYNKLLSKKIKIIKKYQMIYQILNNNIQMINLNLIQIKNKSMIIKITFR